MTKTHPNTRRQRIEALAAIAFGRTPDGGPEKGWQRKLSRALGVASSTITATLELGHDSPPMDRKLAAFAHVLKGTLAEGLAELDELEFAFGGTRSDTAEPESNLQGVHLRFHAPEKSLPYGWRVSTVLSDTNATIVIDHPEIDGSVIPVDGGWIAYSGEHDILDTPSPIRVAVKALTDWHKEQRS